MYEVEVEVEVEVKKCALYLLHLLPLIAFYFILRYSLFVIRYLLFDIPTVHLIVQPPISTDFSRFVYFFVCSKNLISASR